MWSIIRALAAGSSVGRALSACIAESIGVRVPPRAAPFPLKKVLSWVLLNIIDCCVRGHLYYGSPKTIVYCHVAVSYEELIEGRAF